MMSQPKTRPGNPERGWNDPPMFNFTPGVQAAPPRRTLNKRVAFPASAPSQPGHAVLSPSAGPPVLNPVLSGSILSQPEIVKPPQVFIGPKDTPLGNQAPPISPVQILPPSDDASAPQAVPLLVPGLIPAAPPLSKDRAPQVGIDNERLEELLSRLSLSDETLLEYNLNLLHAELDKHRPVLTTKVCEDITKKLGLVEEKWRNGGFSEIVKVRVTQLAEALSKEQTDKANQLHLALMVDHISEVNQWMMGVKRLIQQQQVASKEREMLSDKTDKTDFMTEESIVNQWMMGVKRLIQQQQLASKERELFSDKTDKTDFMTEEGIVKGDNCDNKLQETDREIQGENKDSTQDTNEDKESAMNENDSKVGQEEDKESS